MSDLREAVLALPVHPIGGYEWECDECHYHFVGRPCWITGVVAARDGTVDSKETPSDHGNDLVSRESVLALLDGAA